MTQTMADTEAVFWSRHVIFRFDSARHYVSIREARETNVKRVGKIVNSMLEDLHSDNAEVRVQIGGEPTHNNLRDMCNMMSIINRTRLVG